MTTGLMLLTIGLPWLGAVVVWLLGAGGRRWTAGASILNGVAAAFALAAALAGLALLPLATAGAAVRLPLGGPFGEVSFVPDGLGVFLAAVATGIGSLTVLFSIDYLRGEGELARYYALVLLFIGAMAGLVLSGSLLMLFFFWEMTAFCSYALISFHNDDPRAVRAGVKALLMTQIGGAGLLVGALVVYAHLGSLDMGVFLRQHGLLPAGALALVAFAFLAAAAAKSAQVPFHSWLPDAMEAPTPVSALIHAATMVNAGVYLLARFYPALSGVPGWTTAVIAVGVASAVLAALMALVATDLKRVLAYSTVSQLGFMVYAVGVGAIFASQFHLLSHAVFKALLFLAAGAVIHAVGTRDMRQMGGLWAEMPLVGRVFALGAAALAGVPLLNGFWSKEAILEAGLHDGPWWAYAAMLGTAGLTALYIFRAAWLVFLGHPAAGRRGHDATRWMRLPLQTLALGTVTTWLWAGPLAALLAQTLPFHRLRGPTSTMELVAGLTLATPTLVAMAVVAVGLAAWWWRDRLAGAAARLEGVARLAVAGFGFEWINSRLVALTQATAQALQASQTGQLNWNVAAIAGALALALLLLAGSG